MTNYEAITGANVVELAAYLYEVQKAERDRIKQMLYKQGIELTELAFSDDYYILKLIEWLKSEAEDE